MLFLSLAALQQAHVYSQPEYRILLIYVPGLPLELLNASHSPLHSLWNRTYVVRVDPEPPYTLLYHELLLVNTTWDLRERPVLESGVALDGGGAVSRFAVSYDVVNSTWGQLDTVFINIRSIDPLAHNRTINPYYNYSSRLFPPQLLTLEINEFSNWTLLNTSIVVTLVNGTYKVTIEGHVRDVAFKNDTLDTDPILLNITRANLTVGRGVYNIKFRIVDANESHVTIFTPGTLEQYNWLSKYYGIYTRPIVPSLPISYFPYLGRDDIEWAFNETIRFYSDIVSIAYRHREATLYVLGVPLYEEIYYGVFRGYINSSTAANLTSYLIRSIHSIVNTTKARLGDIYLAVYAPYSLVNKTARDIAIEGLELVAPGLYRVNGSLASVLEEIIENDIEFYVLESGGEHYIAVKYENFTLNGHGNIDYGYFALYPSASSNETLTTNTRAIVGYIASLARGLGLGLTDANKIINSLRGENRNLRDQIRSLNRTASELNSTLASTQMDLARCRAENLNASSLVNTLRGEIDKLERRERQWIAYALAGTASVFATLIVLYIIGTRGLKKGK